MRKWEQQALMVLRDDAFFESARYDYRIRGGNELLPRASADRLKENDAWYAAFDVKPGDKLYLAPANRVRIW
jgi:hypothetical protein